MTEPVERVIEHWREEHPDHSIEVFTTQAKLDAFNQAKAAGEYDVVISGGGDGTNNEVINGLMRIPLDQRPGMAILPLGSGNDFARMLPKRTPIDLLERLANDPKEQSVDVIEVKHNDHVRYALNMVTCGIGAEIAASVNRRKFSLPPAFNYYRAIIQWLLKYKAPEITLRWDRDEVRSKTLLTAFGNGTYAGNGLGLNPQSSINDGRMGLTLIGNVGVIDFIRYQSTLKAGRYVKDKRLRYEKTVKAELTVHSGQCAVESDGEEFSRLQEGEKIQITLLPKAIRII